MIIGTNDNKFDIDTHSTLKFLFYHFNNLRRDFGEGAYKIRHTIISDDLYAIRKALARARIGHILLIVYWKFLMVIFHHSI